MLKKYISHGLNFEVEIQSGLEIHWLVFPQYFWNETMNFWGGFGSLSHSFGRFATRVCVTPVVLKCFDMSGHGIYNHPTVWTILVLPKGNVHSPCLCFIFPECKCKSCDMPESICCPSSRPLWHPPRFPRTCVGAANAAGCCSIQVWQDQILQANG